MATIGLNTELFYVRRAGLDEDYTLVLTYKEIQSMLTTFSMGYIKKIEKAILVKGDEVEFDYFKPKKYKNQPWTYAEKHGVGRNGY